MKGDIDDPKALIREGYNIPGISYGECRTVFLDWTLSVSNDKETSITIKRLLEKYALNYPDHPMTQVLRESLAPAPAPVRRGGWRGRRNG